VDELDRIAPEARVELHLARGGPDQAVLRATGSQRLTDRELAGNEPCPMGCVEATTMATVRRATRAQRSSARERANVQRYWSQHVTKTSDSLDLEPGVFRFEDPRDIAASLRRSRAPTRASTRDR
jgi:hypothetical protein